MVGVFLDDRPTFLLGAQATHSELVRDRSFTLVVGGIAGVERDSHARASLVWEAVARQSGRLLLDKIARSLPCKLPDKIDEAGVWFASIGNQRNRFIAGLGDQSKRRGCGLPLPCHVRPIG